MAPPGSACGASLKALQGPLRSPWWGSRRSGKSRSMAAAWWAAALLALVHVHASAESRTPLPALQKAQAGTQCVEPADVMRRNHMRFLKHQRDDTVRAGVRGARHSLKDCVDCHASPTTGSVIKADADFCSSCHRYAAVSIDCFECHTGSSRKLTSGVSK
mgnify:CR=1 FL=1